MEPGRRDICKPIGKSVPDRAKSEKAPLTKPELYAVELWTWQRPEAAPDQLPAKDRFSRGERDPTHRRVNAVGADHEIVFSGGTVAEGCQDVVFVLAQRSYRNPKAT